MRPAQGCKQRVRLLGLATRSIALLLYSLFWWILYTSYPTIIPHYRTPLYNRDLRDVGFIVSSRFTIKALSLRSCSAPFDPGSRRFLGGQLHTRTCTTTWHNTWRALASEPEINLGGPICMWGSKQLCVYHFSETWFWLYVTFKTHLFASLDMPISKDL